MKVLLLLIVSVLTAPSVYASKSYRYDLRHTGFDDGAAVIGTFFGTDLDNNGRLINEEVTRFNIDIFWDEDQTSPPPAYTINDANVSPLARNFDLWIFPTINTEPRTAFRDFIDVANTVTGIDQGWYQYFQVPTQGEAPRARIADWFNGLQLSSTLPDSKVSEVPVPPVFWLLGSGLIGLIGARHRYKLDRTIA